jgi:peptide chain release factor 2
MAMKMLRSRVYELALQKRRTEAQKLEDSKADNAFGTKHRSYVLHPYRMAKDHRTMFEVGDIDGFIKAHLLSRRRTNQF